MIVRGVVAMLLAGLLCSGSPATAQEATPEAEKPKAEMAPTWYAQAFARGPGGLNVSQFWSKGSRLRAETVVAGHKVVTIVNGDWYVAYDATKGLGIRVRRTEEALANDASYKRPFGNEAVNLIKRGGEKIRDEVFHGRPAVVYQRTDQLGRRTIWTTADALNIPLRIEFYNRRTATEQTTDYIDWLTGLEIPDAFFEPEGRIEIKSYEFSEYARFTSEIGGVGPVPVLYMDLLRGR